MMGKGADKVTIRYSERGRRESDNLFDQTSYKHIKGGLLKEKKTTAALGVQGPRETIKEAE